MTVELGSAYGEIIIDGDAARAGVQKAQVALGGLQSFGIGVGVALGQAFIKAGATIGRAMAGVVTSSIGMAADLEEQMSNIASVMGIAGDEVGELQDLILELGINPNLKVSTLEAAAAIEMLGRNGLSTIEILNGAAEATVLLANATGADFATAANIATDAMALFDIGAEEMIGATDLIAAVVTNSKFSVEDFQLALAQGGGVASTLGLTLEEFTTVIAGIAPSFASGSDAGTSFKTMLQRLTAPTDQAKALMNQLGIEVFDAEGNMKSMAEITGMLESALYGVSEATVEVGGRTNAQNEELARLQGIYDRTLLSIRDYEAGIKGAGLSEEARAKKLEELQTVLGNVTAEMGPLLDITGEMTTVTRQLTEEERAQALTMLFGADAIRAASALAELGIEGFENLAAVMGDTSAVDMAAQRMDNFKGKLEVAAGIVETLKIKIGDAFLPILTDLAEGVGQFLEQHGDKFVAFFEGVATFITTFVEALREGEGPIDSFFEALESVGVSQETIDKLQEIVDTVGDFIDKVVGYVSEHSEAFKGALLGIGAVLVAGGVLAAIGAAAGFIASLANPITLIIGLAALLGAAWAENWGGIRDKTEEIVNQIKEKIDFEQVFADVERILGNAREFFEEVFGEIKRSVEGGLTPLETVGEILDNFIPEETMTKVWDFLLALQDFGRYMGEVVESGDPLNDFLERLPEGLQPLAELFGEAAAAVKEFIDGFGPFIEEQGGKISTWFQENGPLIKDFLAVLGEIGAVLVGIWAAGWAIATRELARFGEVVKPILGGALDLILGLAETVMQMATGDWAGAWETIKETAGKVWEAIKETFVEFVDWVAGWFDSSFQEIVDTWSANWEQLTTAVGTVWENIKTAIAEKIDEIRTAISEKIEEIRTSITERFEAIKEGITTTWENIKLAILQKIMELFERMGLDFDEMKARWSAIWNDVQFIVGEVWSRIVTAVTEKVQEVKLAIQTKVEEIKAEWGAKWDEITAKLEEIWNTIVTAVSEKIEEVRSVLGDKTEEARSNWSEKWEEIKEKVGEILAAILTAVIEELLEMIAAINTKFQEAVDAIGDFVGRFVEAGKNVIRGVIDGILSMGGELLATITGMMEGLIAQAMAALSENSPSMEFFRIGAWAIQGLEEGVIDRMAAALGVVFDAGKELVHGMAEGVEAGQTELEEKLQSLVDMANEALSGVFDMVSSSLSAGSGFGRIASFFAKQLVDPAKDALDAIDGRIGELKDNIKEQTDGKTNLSTLGNAKVALGRAERAGDKELAADLREYIALQEKRSAAEEDYIAAQERLLAVQEKQQKLAFLKNQLDLIEMLQEAGLNPANVLKGITLGIDASADDLLNASEAAMSAMINQANVQLGQAQSVAVSAWDAMTAGSETSLQQFIDMVAAMFSGAARIVYGAGQMVGTSFADGIAAAQSQVQGAMNQLGMGLKNFNQGALHLVSGNALAAAMQGIYNHAPALGAPPQAPGPSPQGQPSSFSQKSQGPGHTFNMYIYKTDDITADYLVGSYHMMKSSVGA